MKPNRLPIRAPRAPWLLALTLGVAAFGVAGSAAAQDIEPKARLHLDYGQVHPEPDGPVNNTIVRRATLGLEGKFGDDWEFEVGYNLADDGNFRPGEGGFRDLTVTWEGWQAGDLTVGQFKVPFGMQEVTSSNDIIFMERALPVDAFAPGRREGIGFSHKRSAWTFRTMAFGSSIDGDDRGRGLAARVTFAPVHTGATVLHLGVAGAIENPYSKVDFDTAPESRIPDDDLVNTGRIADVHRLNRLGLEGAWRTGPVSVQTEWMQVDVRRDAGRPDARLNGWYVAGSWVLTGETRPYKYGEFKGIEPAGPGGAWELTARYSHINLDDAMVAGGREHNVTLGLNYYLNEHVRFMFNYVHARSERRGVSDNPDMVLLRAQFVY